MCYTGLYVSYGVSYRLWVIIACEAKRGRRSRPSWVHWKLLLYFYMRIVDKAWKSLKMIVETSNKNQFSFIDVLTESISKFNLARSGSTMTLFDGKYLRQYFNTDVKFWYNLDSSLKIVQLKFEIDIFHNLETKRFSASLKFSQFSAVLFIKTFDWIGNF